jgi:oligopeptide/dipeptide ABC transporter ATP-binding protein
MSSPADTLSDLDSTEARVTGRVEDPLVAVTDLQKSFTVRSTGRGKGQHASVQAVAGVTFEVGRGETLALVGESGCGKTTLGRTLLRLEEPTSGDIQFAGRDVVAMKSKELRRLRRDVQMIYQDPYASLNPRMTAAQIIAEPLFVHRIGTRDEQVRRVAELLDRVGLSARAGRKYPHEFSGGQRQRIGIARALAADPAFVVCDEPVSALDVSIQAQVLNLLTGLRDEFGLTYLFISHNLAVVRHIADRVAVMYLGKIVELAPTQEFFSNPRHPYSTALLSAVPVPDPDVEQERRRIVLTGDLPSPANPPSGCRFNTRCAFAQDICREKAPPTESVKPGHTVACHFWPTITQKAS